MRNEHDEDKKMLVMFYHDKSIQYTKSAGQCWMWREDEHPALLPKMKGSRIMVTDSVVEHTGYLAFTPEEQKVKLISSDNL